MSDSTPLTPGNDAPTVRPKRPAAAMSSRLIAGPKRAGQFERGTYAQQLNRGYSSAMSRGLELTITLLVMVGIGLLLDRFFGTFPIFTIIASVLGFAGTTVKLWLGYDLEMRKHEDGAIWNRGKVAR